MGNNHEWGLTMITPILNHYDNRYQYYIGRGYSDSNASDYAFSDTVSYIPVFKSDAVWLCQSSLSFFEGFFSLETMMDFWNNCYGRAYPAKGYSSGLSAFQASRNAGEIVESAWMVSPAIRSSIWSWDWYSY